METRINVKNSISRKTIGNLFLLIGILIITTLEWHFYEWYESFTKYGTLITFAALTVAFFCYVDINTAIKDKFVWLMVITDAVALTNLFILKSNKGCILIVVDFMLILYLIDKVEFSRFESIVMLSYVGAFFFYWTIDVKGYFKGYNTNYGGLILITGFACVMVLMQMLYEKRAEEYDTVSLNKNNRVEFYKNNWWIFLLYVVLIIISFKIISWYRSRTALMGLVVLLALIFIPAKIIINKFIYSTICVLATIGSVAFSGIYILLGGINGGEGVQLFYKDIISGRNEIWSELWYAFLDKPFTGIGSSYEMKLEYMAGMLEAHSAMMDILVIHGIVVFVLLCGFFLFRLFKFREKAMAGGVNKAIFAAIICVLITGFFENYYIVQPFSLILLCLFTINPKKTQSTNC